METNRLRQFTLIVETGNFRKAAELLGISHSGLSKSMRALELEVGTSLFAPHGRGVIVTDEGRKLFERCTPFFSELNRLLGKEEVKHPNLVRIGSFEVFTSYFMGKLSKDYLKDFEIEVHDLAPSRLEEALLTQKIDIGITYEPMPRSGIDYVKIMSLEMAAFKLQGSFPGLQILDIPFAVPANPLEGAPSGVRGRDAWPDERLKRKVLFRVDQMTTGIEFVRQGLCTIFIPRFVATLHNETVRANLRLEEVPLPRHFGTVKRDVFIVKRASTPESLAIRRIAKALRKIC